MTPETAKVVDSIFLYVLALLDRIERGAAPVVSDERTKIRSRIDSAEATLGQREDWQLAKYALVAWIDEVLIDAPWDGNQWWNENALEFEYFQTHDRHDRFYSQAEEAAKLPKKDALEVFYVCVVLGFRGLYRTASGASLAEQLGMPPDLESWARKTAMAIQLGQGRPPIVAGARRGTGAPPLEGKFQFVGMTLAAVCLAAITVILAGVLFYGEIFK
jgi:type VI secretion system protein ImpK